MTDGTIYNSTDGPLIIDRAGRVLGARERRDGVDLDASPVSGHIADGRIVVLDDPQPQDSDEQPTTGKGRRASTNTTQEA